MVDWTVFETVVLLVETMAALKVSRKAAVMALLRVSMTVDERAVRLVDWMVVY